MCASSEGKPGPNVNEILTRDILPRARTRSIAGANIYIVVYKDERSL